MLVFENYDMSQRLRLGPDGAAASSRGWSLRGCISALQTEPVDSGFLFFLRPNGARVASILQAFGTVKTLMNFDTPAPLGRKTKSTIFHGFRRNAGYSISALPVATFGRPVGAKTSRSEHLCRYVCSKCDGYIPAQPLGIK